MEKLETETLLKLRNVCKSYNKVPAVKNVSMDVCKGERVVFIGASGSGKSTLLRCINYLTVPDEGTIWLNGEFIGGHFDEEGKWVKDSPRELAGKRKNIGMVFQSFNLFSHLNAIQNVTLGPIWVLGKKKGEAEQIARDLLRKVHLESHMHKLPSQLSGGQQQRVAIARALAMNPTLMLFDEPTSALDPKLTREVLDVIVELARERITMIVVTHELGFAKQFADTVVYLENSEIVESGPPNVIFEAPKDERTQLFLSHFIESEV